MRRVPTLERHGALGDRTVAHVRDERDGDASDRGKTPSAQRGRRPGGVRASTMSVTPQARAGRTSTGSSQSQSTAAWTRNAA